MLLHLVEGYWVAADALRSLAVHSMEESEWLVFAREHAEKEFLQGDIRRAESASTAVLKNALQLFIAEGLVVRETRMIGRKSVRYLSMSTDRTLEDIAFRRDDIGAFLLRMNDTSTKRYEPVVPSDALPVFSEREVTLSDTGEYELAMKPPKDTTDSQKK